MSTSNPRRDTYHHGDLRQTLISIGLEMLAEGGADSLSLRGVAKRAGVSHNAPYQHFADKEALIAAIAEEGFRRLCGYIDASQSPLDQAAPASTQLIAAGSSYVQFALENPRHLAVMFGAFPASRYPQLAEAAHAALQRIIEIAAAAQMRGELQTDNPADAAATIWMAAHGLSSVLIAQKFPPGVARERTPLELAETYLRLTCEGLTRRTTP